MQGTIAQHLTLAQWLPLRLSTMITDAPRHAHSPAAIVWARRTTGWSQRRFAKEIGINPSELSRIEDGKRNASYAVLLRMAAVLGCPVTMLQAPCTHRQ